MKKLVMVLFLLAGLSNFTSAQIFSRHDRSEAKSTKTKEVKVKKHQMYHFEKQRKDENIAHNGTALRKEKYKVDKYSFKAINPVRNDRRFMTDAKMQRKDYQATLTRTIFARKRPRSHFAV